MGSVLDGAWVELKEDGDELNADTAAEKASVLGSVPLKLRYHGCTSGLPDCATEGSCATTGA